MKYVLDTPITIGDLDNRITISELRIASFSMNFQKSYADSGVAVLSVIVEDPNTGHSFPITFNDAASLQQWKTLDGIQNVITKALFNRLASAGKIPAGALQ